MQSVFAISSLPSSLFGIFNMLMSFNLIANQQTPHYITHVCKKTECKHVAVELQILLEFCKMKSQKLACKITLIN